MNITINVEKAVKIASGVLFLLGISGGIWKFEGRIANMEAAIDRGYAVDLRSENNDLLVKYGLVDITNDSGVVQFHIMSRDDRKRYKLNQAWLDEYDRSLMPKLHKKEE